MRGLTKYIRETETGVEWAEYETMQLEKKLRNGVGKVWACVGCDGINRR